MIVGADGKPVQKEIKDWKDMNDTEKLDVMRQGLGHIIQVLHVMAGHMDRLIKALEDNDILPEKEEKTGAAQS